MTLAAAAARRPVLAALLCAGTQFLLTVAILRVGAAFAPHAFGAVKLVAFASTIVLPLLLVHWLGLWHRVGFMPGSLKPSPVFLAALLCCVPYLSMGVRAPQGSTVGGELLLHSLNAFGEEVLFRGVMFALLLTLPRWQAMALSGVLFGSMHLIHGFMDATWSEAVSRALLTAVPGLLFTAVRYASASLWPAVLLHMLLNLSVVYSNLDAGGAAAIFMADRVVNALELLIVAFVALDGSRRRATAA
jgi:uncharacterized protein